MRATADRTQALMHKHGASAAMARPAKRQRARQGRVAGVLGEV